MIKKRFHFAAAFGRLCVETDEILRDEEKGLAAAFGRLCVETILLVILQKALESSRLRAAVC